MSMYIEFKLPNGAAGQAAAHYNSKIRLFIAEWAAKHHIHDYTFAIVDKYRLQCRLAQEQDYTVFALTWNTDKHRMMPQPKIVR